MVFKFQYFKIYLLMLGSDCPKKIHHKHSKGNITWEAPSWQMSFKGQQKVSKYPKDQVVVHSLK